ncbi:response regulator [Aerophototrophica crusticola]|uniref:histidine kinase n=1 Tax=Aerophototrophica crusticola TaxID=1709002 RepID=A0A858RAB9_9PROT|nr:response regulator [Rhodospirillaceae bacterium B3]
MPYFRWLLPATVAVPAAMLALAVWMNHAQVMREAEAALARDADIAREHALKVFETQELLLQELSGRVAALRRDGAGWDDVAKAEELHGWMAGRVAGLPQADSLAVVDSAGTARLGSRMFPLAPIDIIKRDYWKAIQGGQPRFLGEPTHSHLTGQVQFHLAHRLPGADQGLDGVVVASFRPAYFERYWAGMAGDTGTSVLLARRDGVVLARWPVAVPGLRLPDGHPALDQDSEAPVVTDHTVDGLRRLVVARDLGTQPAAVVVSRHMGAVLAPWRANSLTFTAIAVPAALILLALALAANRAAGRESAALASLRSEVDRRRATEQALRASETRYRGFFEHTAESLFVVRVGENGRFYVEEINESLARSSGLDPAAITDGREIAETMPDHADQLRRNYAGCVAAGKPVSYEQSLDLPAGQRHYETILVPLRDPDGRITHLLGSSRDVTERKLADQRLVQAQKMETVGQLTGGVAHDFNNLLTAVITNLELVRSLPDPEADPERLDGALKAARAGAALVKRLLAFARMQPLEPRPTDLGRLVAETLPLLTHAVGERVAVGTDIPAGLPPVLVDPVQLENGLLNLAVNARDAMPAGGRLTISARRHAGPDGKDWVTLSVADTGEGMPPAVASRIFEPFFTTKPPGKGTGLGLATLYGFMQQSGGQVTLETAQGGGTRFDLAFPATAARAAPPPELAPAPPLETARRGGATVLLVEDEALVRLSTEDLLTELGYRVVSAGSAEEALDLLAAGQALDVLVTDIGLPGMDGKSLARAATAQHPHLPVVLMSGYDRTAGDGTPWLQLEKPYSPDRLAQALRQALGEPARLAKSA